MHVGSNVYLDPELEVLTTLALAMIKPVRNPVISPIPVTGKEEPFDAVDTKLEVKLMDTLSLRFP